ncbi:MAG: cation transporter [bacterium]|jgi:mercuric ion binding protein
MSLTMMLRRTVLIAACALALPANADERTVLLTIPKMSTADCQVVVTDALKDIDGVRKVTAAYSTKSAYVTFEDGKTNLDSLKKATEDEGYPVSESVEVRAK